MGLGGVKVIGLEKYSHQRHQHRPCSRLDAILTSAMLLPYFRMPLSRKKYLWRGVGWGGVRPVTEMKEGSSATSLTASLRPAPSVCAGRLSPPLTSQDGIFFRQTGRISNLLSSQSPEKLRLHVDTKRMPHREPDRGPLANASWRGSPRRAGGIMAVKASQAELGDAHRPLGGPHR